MFLLLASRVVLSPNTFFSLTERRISFCQLNLNENLNAFFAIRFARACLRDANTRQSRHTRVKRCVLLFKFSFKFVLTTDHPGGTREFTMRESVRFVRFV